MHGTGKNSWKIFVISLQDATKRRERIGEQLARQNLAFRFIDAIDGRGGLSSRHKQRVDYEAMIRNLGRPMSDAECACSLSHLKVYRQIVNEGLDGAVVLEDDALWSEQATSLLSSLNPGTYDFIQLDYGVADFWRFCLRKTVADTEIRLVRLAKNAALASAYIISQRGAKYILKNGSPVALPADWPCSLRPLKPMATIPRVCKQDRSPSVESSVLKEGRDNLRREYSLVGISSTGGSIPNAVKRNAPPPIPHSLYRLLTKHIPKA